MVAIVGRDRQRQEETLQENTMPGFDVSKVRIYCGEDGFRQMLEDKEIEAVISAAPSNIHEEQGLAIAKAGKHLLVEKPLALSIPETDNLIRAFEESGRQLGVIFQLRYNPEIRALKRLIEEEKFGKIGMGSVLIQKGRDEKYWKKKEWFGIQAEGGDAISNQSIHQIDNMQHLVGFENIESVFALAQILDADRPLGDSGWRKKDAVDSGGALFRLKNGGWITVHMSTVENKHAEHKDNIQSIALTSRGKNNYIKLGGEKTDTFEVINLENLWYKAYYTSTGEVRFLPEKEQPPPGCSEEGPSDPYLLLSHYEQIFEFLNCLGKNEKFSLDGKEAKKSLALVIAIYESAVNQKEIVISDVFQGKTGRPVTEYLFS